MGALLLIELLIATFGGGALAMKTLPINDGWAFALGGCAGIVACGFGMFWLYDFNQQLLGG